MCALAALNEIEDEVFCRPAGRDLEDEIVAYKYIIGVVYSRLNNSHRISRGLDFEDYYSVGLEALWRAIITHDSNKSKKTTYFFHVVKWAMQQLSKWRSAKGRANWGDISIDEFNELGGEWGSHDAPLRQASVDAFQDKNAAKEIFQNQIRVILSECVATTINQSPPASSKKAKIFARQAEVLKRWCQGKSLRQIAKEVEVSQETVRQDLRATNTRMRRCLKKNHDLRVIQECMY